MQNGCNPTKCRCAGQMLTPHDYQKCCKNAIYDSRNQTCINRKIRRIRNGSPCGIYGEGEIAVDRFMCCSNFFHRIINGGDQCCGGHTFNSTMDICCGRVVFNAAERKCCNGQPIAVHEECCNGRGYDQQEAACCGGEVFDLSEIRSHGIDTTQCCPAGQRFHVETGRCYNKGKSTNIHICQDLWTCFFLCVSHARSALFVILKLS